MKQTPTFTLPLNPAERKALKALAHHLDPVVIVGDAGLTAAVIAEIQRSLAAHELIKIRVLGDDRDARNTCLHEICARTGAAPVQRIGKLLVVYLPLPAEVEANKGPHVPKKRAAVGLTADSTPARRRPRTPAKTPSRPAPAGVSRSPSGRVPSRRASSDGAPPRAPGQSLRSPARSPSRSPTGGPARSPARPSSKGSASAATRSSTRSSAGPTRATPRSSVRRGPKKS